MVVVVDWMADGWIREPLFGEFETFFLNHSARTLPLMAFYD
jgi:hypothetical protein